MRVLAAFVFVLAAMLFACTPSSPPTKLTMAELVEMLESDAHAGEMDQMGASAYWQRLVRIDGFDTAHDALLVDNTMRFFTNGQNVAYTDETTLEAFTFNTAVIGFFTVSTCVCMTMDDDITAIGMFGDGTQGCGLIADPNATIPDSSRGVCKLWPANMLRTAFLNSTAYPDYGRAISATSKAGYRDRQCEGGSVATYPCDAGDNTDCPGTGGVCGSSTNASNKVFLAFRGTGAGEGWIEQAK